MVRMVLAIATVGAVGLDHIEGERLRAARDAERRAAGPSGDSGTSRP
jgi:hypothetical protein